MSEYIGNLYGRVAGKYFPLGITSVEFDKLQAENAELRKKLERAVETLRLMVVKEGEEYPEGEWCSEVAEINLKELET